MKYTKYCIILSDLTPFDCRVLTSSYNQERGAENRCLEGTVTRMGAKVISETDACKSLFGNECMQ